MDDCSLFGEIRDSHTSGVKKRKYIPKSHIGKFYA